MRFWAFSAGRAAAFGRFEACASGAGFGAAQALPKLCQSHWIQTFLVRFSAFCVAVPLRLGVLRRAPRELVSGLPRLC